MRYDVQSPVKGYNGETGGVRFYKGRGHVDSAENPAAVAYMRRRGYTLTEIREEQPEQAEEPQTPSEDTTPNDPAQTEVQKQEDSGSQPLACECEEKPCEHTPKDEAPVKPKQSDDKATWVAYIASATDLTEAEANDLKKAELIELAEVEKEQTS
ncbi:hypothetical protein [Nocardiopsis synnemataformans]|uniref:hypothetical protein n=1 Tax=Nocardiopsis synnemataformans TaxID=61305 RepID=UPI003EB81D23